MTNPCFSAGEILQIARRQKNTLILILVSIPASLIEYLPLNFPDAAEIVLLVGFVALGIVGAVLVYRLAKALRSGAAWLYVVCAFIPCVSLISLLILNQHATRTLRAHGVEVGLMGGPPANAAQGTAAAITIGSSSGRASPPLPF